MFPTFTLTVCLSESQLTRTLIATGFTYKVPSLAAVHMLDYLCHALYMWLILALFYRNSLMSKKMPQEKSDIKKAYQK